jgi:hypothetical protein
MSPSAQSVGFSSVNLRLQAALSVAQGNIMIRLAFLLIAVSSLFSGCVAYDPGYRQGGDRDRDGVPNKEDRRPNNPNKY